jgi:hypothetical protein
MPNLNGATQESPASVLPTPTFLENNMMSMFTPRKLNNTHTAPIILMNSIGIEASGIEKLLVDY